MSVSIIAIDIAKAVFQIVGVDSRNHLIFEHRLRRAKLAQFMTQQPPTRVVMEACYTAHDWGRRFEAMGHRVELIPPQHVKPFVRGNKNDRNDALAIAEAADRPNMRYVPVKSPEQQAILGLHRVRQRLVKQRVQLMNQTRGLLAEFGQVYPLGHKAFRTAVLDCDEHSHLPRPMVLVVQQAGDEYRRISEQLEGLEVELMGYVTDNDDCQRLLGIPGIGPLTASALVASVGRGQAFANPREFAVWLGLTPKHSASGDKSHTAGISKRGDRYLRTLFIHGARAALRWTSTRDDNFSQWANNLRQRCGHHKAMVAVAHKMARISWALMYHQTSFTPD